MIASSQAVKLKLKIKAFPADAPVMPYWGCQD